ncbi:MULTISPECIES: glycoside hydrolase family 3 N-terminal domain-containing protein [unclassified Solwaraspora]|uniref:glycoside hydrolase family 3 N-terminal domain-containing protein n=1 Tax=unclassified Solwaraspora TaxID=2627926 RepID=UPI00259BE8C6|nr:glycoside hydrolase family 3 N-terminal domain-containing protein [Solwaraspora sp. WMMA2056]WJK43483.1 glycoside hydrolase family 3 N-terminal domain-containing protein [Solwaraspora sp. WMMA2056]
MAGVFPSPRVTIAALLLAAVGVTTGCAEARTGTPNATPSSADEPSAAPTSTAESATPAARLVATLSDEDLVGQVLMPYAYGASATEVSAGSAAGNRELAGVDTPAEMIERYRLGGLILVGFSADDPTGSNQPTTNVDDTAQVRQLTTGLQEAAGRLPAAALPDGGGELPLLIGTDQEFGIVTRITQGVTLLPSAMAAGAAGQPELTEAAWRAAGAELAALGVNVDFAPVADVLGVDSTVIGSRSYGADPAAAAAQVAAAVRGLQAAGVAATLKHFPGHGHTAVDSHGDLPVLDQDRDALGAADLPPFVAGIDAGAGLVMSGHLDVTAVDPGVAATFSRKVLTDLLRGELGFDGVAVTDGMNMAPAQVMPPGEAAVAAINAGNDLILMPPNVSAAYDGLLAALRDGSLPRERLQQAVTRVLTLKQRLAEAAVPPMTVLGAAGHYAAARQLAAAAITQVRGSCSGVDGPVTVTASGGRDRTRALLVEALRAGGVEVVDRGGTVVHLVGYGDGTADLSSAAAVTVAMDTPYLLASSRSPSLLATYSSSPASMEALADVLRGAAPAPGRLPVPVDGLPATSCTS